MKKVYMTPELEEIQITTVGMLAASGGITGSLSDENIGDGSFVEAPGFDPMQEVLKDMGLGGFPF